jgi:crotonobetainyl-CoA:carnitine CoA-transferase CaiB-like acyl-CoA transferase
MQQDTGHGKRSCALELNDPADAQTLRGLITGTDVFSQGYRPGSLAARGFGVDDVMALRPGVVYVSISAFGHEGPWATRRGFDSVVQSVSGMFDECARDDIPRSLPANPLDYATGYLAAFGAMVALGRRAREGGSYHVRVSLAQTGRWLASIPRVEGWQERPAELPQERLQSLMTTSETPFGKLRHLAPCAQMSETPGRWDLPSAPLDNDPPQW